MSNLAHCSKHKINSQPAWPSGGMEQRPAVSPRLEIARFWAWKAHWLLSILCPDVSSSCWGSPFIEKLTFDISISWRHDPWSKMPAIGAIGFFLPPGIGIELMTSITQRILLICLTKGELGGWIPWWINKKARRQVFFAFTCRSSSGSQWKDASLGSTLWTFIIWRNQGHILVLEFLEREHLPFLESMCFSLTHNKVVPGGFLANHLQILHSLVLP